MAKSTHQASMWGLWQLGERGSGWFEIFVQPGAGFVAPYSVSGSDVDVAGASVDADVGVGANADADAGADVGVGADGGREVVRPSRDLDRQLGGEPDTRMSPPLSCRPQTLPRPQFPRQLPPRAPLRTLFRVGSRTHHSWCLAAQSVAGQRGLLDRRGPDTAAFVGFARLERAGGRAAGASVVPTAPAGPSVGADAQTASKAASDEI